MTQTAALRLLNAATTTGDGPVFNLEFPQLAAAVQAEIAGAPSQAVINVMALIDGGTWDTLCVLDTSQAYVSGDISPVASRPRALQCRRPGCAGTCAAKERVHAAGLRAHHTPGLANGKGRNGRSRIGDLVRLLGVRDSCRRVSSSDGRLFRDQFLAHFL